MIIRSTMVPARLTQLRGFGTAVWPGLNVPNGDAFNDVFKNGDPNFGFGFDAIPVSLVESAHARVTPADLPHLQDMAQVISERQHWDWPFGRTPDRAHAYVLARNDFESALRTIAARELPPVNTSADLASAGGILSFAKDKWPWLVGGLVAWRLLK